MAASEHTLGRHSSERVSGEVTIGADPIRIEELIALARGEAIAVLSDDAAFRNRLAESHEVVARQLGAGAAIYGVTTGVGASVGTEIPEDLRSEMPLNLVRMHGVGTGRILDEVEAAAVVAARLISLARGFSGVRPALLERLCALLNERLLPRIPAEGSVGASGDLTPLSYLAATLAGEREATLRGEPVRSLDGLRALGLAPLELRVKESLSLMNGTSVMTALGCLALERAFDLARLACAVTATVSDVTLGNPECFAARIAELKPHPGQVKCAAWIREMLGAPRRPPARLQDPYSVRCAPQVLGVLLDAAEFARGTLETELNGVDDNPIVDPEGDRVLHGGNFYGGHVAFAMDALKAAVASVADLLDRQLALLCSPAKSAGLPENLVAADGAAAVTHHGFKAMQITASALAAEALKLTLPAAAFSRSTESHNQDKVSMGTVAARDCLRVLELSETVAAAVLIAACQGVDLRDAAHAPPAVRALRDTLRKEVPLLSADRRQDGDLARTLALHRAGTLPLPGRT